MTSIGIGLMKTHESWFVVRDTLHQIVFLQLGEIAMSFSVNLICEMKLLTVLQKIHVVHASKEPALKPTVMSCSEVNRAQKFIES
jgi:hypothetical protein